MLCKIAGNTRKSNSPRTACHYLFPIEKNFLQTVNQETEAVSTDSAFDIVTIWGVNSEFSASVDYRLYRNCDEEDPVYNYFSIEASIQIDPASGHTESVRMRCELPHSSDNLTKIWPDSQSGDAVDCREDYTNDTAAWERTRRSFSPFSAGEALLTCGASWAAQESLEGSVEESLETGIDLYYDGTVNMGPFGQYPSTAGFAEIPIRFYFQD